MDNKNLLEPIVNAEWNVKTDDPNWFTPLYDFCELPPGGPGGEKPCPCFRCPSC